ncbi:MAG: type I DNA topoisomerase, partial [Finegoldia magna]|nr:type I DNA topoisomerase [Finegoldia magna]
IKKPEAIDLKLVDAQQARRVLDRIVGYSISPLLWKKVKSGLSAGRVQSVALRLICEREKEIREFEPEEYWSIHANLSKEKLEFDSELYYSKNDKSNKINIKNKDEADKILNDLSENFVVDSIKQQKKSRKPYAPFTTSTLQQESYKKLYFQTSKTMRIAQQLYEGISLGSEGSVGLITYMRTDSTRISHVCVSDCIDIINNLYGKQYATKGYDYSKKKKGSQDAHEGIRPSSVKRRPNEIKKYLTDDQYKLYKLIWERTVASQMKDARYLSTSIDFDNNGYTFRSNGNVVIFDGFTRVYSLNTKDSELPELKEKESIASKEIESKQHFTKPKPRYTEASLVKTLEEDGIGRPSTYALIISSILSRNYVELKEKKNFIQQKSEKKFVNL